MKLVKLIHNLKVKVANLEYEDPQLENVLFEIKMILKKYLDETEANDFSSQIESIGFYFPFFGSSSDSDAREYWNDGVHKLLGLLNVIESYIGLNEVLPETSSLETSDVDAKPKSNKIFIVHGHDDAMKLEVKNVLQQLGLDPIILHEQDDNGQTVIEKFETESKEVEFAVVLLSPDDIGNTVNTKYDDLNYRARQNVILELGYFTGRLGRNKTFSLVKQPPNTNLEQPSDFAGVIYTNFDSNGGWKLKLSKALKSAGYSINLDALIN